MNPAGAPSRHRSQNPTVVVVSFAVLMLAVTVPTTEADEAEDAVILRPVAGETLVAGTHYLVRWSAPRAAEELELLLVLDDGPAGTIRLTEELDPGDGVYSWRVPHLPVSAARLMIRWGCDGVEKAGRPGPTFVIRADSADSAHGLRWFAGEWWLKPGWGLTELPPTSTRLGDPQSVACTTPKVAWAPGQDWLQEPSSSCLGRVAAGCGPVVSDDGAWPAGRQPLLLALRC